MTSQEDALAKVFTFSDESCTIRHSIEVEGNYLEVRFDYHERENLLTCEAKHKGKEPGKKEYSIPSNLFLMVWCGEEPDGVLSKRLKWNNDRKVLEVRFSPEELKLMRQPEWLFDALRASLMLWEEPKH